MQVQLASDWPPRNPYIPRVRDLKVHLPVPSAPTAAKNLDHVGGVVGIAMNSVLFVHEHPEENDPTYTVQTLWRFEVSGLEWAVVFQLLWACFIFISNIGQVCPIA